jgi:hypothetical protein
MRRVRTFQWSRFTEGTCWKEKEFLRGKGWAGAGWSALRKAAGRYSGAVRLLEGWNWVKVVGNSYEDEDEEVFVGEVPVEVAEIIRWGEDGEDSVSWEDRVDAVCIGTWVVEGGKGWWSEANVVGEVWAIGNLILGDTWFCCCCWEFGVVDVGRADGDGWLWFTAIVGWAGRCCRADNSAMTSMSSSALTILVTNRGYCWRSEEDRGKL